MQIALQLAVLISKIARLDYPKEWYAYNSYQLSLSYGWIVLYNAFSRW
jgi:hypothetical protein